MGLQRTAVLVHGFLRTSRNMRPLAVRLEAAGYWAILALSPPQCPIDRN